MYMGALPFATCPITSLTPPVWRFHVNCTVRGGKKGITKLTAVEVVLSQQNSDCRYYQPHLTLPEHHRAPDTVPAHTQPVPPLTGVSPCTCVCLRHTALRTAMGTLPPASFPLHRRRWKAFLEQPGWSRICFPDGPYDA